METKVVTSGEANNVATEPETKGAIAKVVAEAKAVVEETKAEVEKVVEKTRVEISDAEKVVVLRQENQFLQLTTQARELQKQIETIQKSFPEYLKTLATKYELDMKEWQFNSIEGIFNKIVKK